MSNVQCSKKNAKNQTPNTDLRWEASAAADLLWRDKPARQASTMKEGGKSNQPIVSHINLWKFIGRSHVFQNFCVIRRKRGLKKKSQEHPELHN
jgi:hypothetical protein